MSTETIYGLFGMGLHTWWLWGLTSRDPIWYICDGSPHLMIVQLDIDRDPIWYICDGSPHLMIVQLDIDRDHVWSIRDGSPHQMTVGLDIHRDHIWYIQDRSPHLMIVGLDVHRDHLWSIRDGSPHLMIVGLDVHRDHLWSIRDRSPHLMIVGLDVHRDHLWSIRDGSPHLMIVGLDVHRDHILSVRDGSPHLYILSCVTITGAVLPTTQAAVTQLWGFQGWSLSRISLWPHCVPPFQAASFFCRHTDTSYPPSQNKNLSPKPFLLLCSKAMEFSSFWHPSYSILMCLQNTLETHLCKQYHNKWFWILSFYLPPLDCKLYYSTHFPYILTFGNRSL